jgi:hypothetical protein
MIALLTRRTIDLLLAVPEGPCLTLYLPTHRFGPETVRDHATLEQLLREARERLVALGVDPETSRFLRPVERLIGDDELWQHSLDGLAIFLAPGFLRLVRAATPFPPTVEVGERFVVAPLIAALPPLERLYVLALSRNEVRLLEVTVHGQRRLALDGLPANMEAALGYQQYYSEVQVHSAGPRGLGRRSGMVHGHGDGDEERFDRDLLQYFRKVASSLRNLPEPDAPIVLATVRDQVPLFRQACEDRRLFDTPIVGNPELTSDFELAAKARALVLGDVANRRRSVALARFRELGDRRTSVDVGEIVSAAWQGRVDTLLVPTGVHRWGHYQPDLCHVELHSERELGDEDLVDMAVVKTWSQGGEVLAIPPTMAPAGAALSAILRY